MPLLENIPIRLSPDYLINSLRLRKRKTASRLIEELIPTAESLITLKVAYSLSYVEGRRGDSVRIGGQTFTSSILQKNLENVEKVFPYIITIGKDLEAAVAGLGDLLKQYYLEVIGDTALRMGKQHLEKKIKKEWCFEKVSSMSPGSLPNWPVTQQKPLFDLLGDTAKEIGVRLTESMLMIPRKSISGLIFPAEVTFTSCRLCDRKRCEARMAPYDENARKRYGWSGEK